MGVLNVTPDSFSDGGRFVELKQSVLQAEILCEQGADWIDIGGESTRPGAKPVGVQEELDRVMPVIEAVHRQCQVPISLDTYKPEVMRAGIRAGVRLINDVNALQAPGVVDVLLANPEVKICLMHKQGMPETMQLQPVYSDVVTTVHDFLAHRVEFCVRQGIDQGRLIIDPGFGFGKRLEHNFSLLKGLHVLQDIGCPILVGISRKSMLGDLLSITVDERTAAGVVAAVIAIQNGASIVRTHDVAETKQGLTILEKTMQMA